VGAEGDRAVAERLRVFHFARREPALRTHDDRRVSGRSCGNAAHAGKCDEAIGARHVRQRFLQRTRRRDRRHRCPAALLRGALRDADPALASFAGASHGPLRPNGPEVIEPELRSHPQHELHRGGPHDAHEEPALRSRDRGEALDDRQDGGALLHADQLGACDRAVGIEHLDHLAGSNPHDAKEVVGSGGVERDPLRDPLDAEASHQGFRS
jgi:hypothetical protein